MLLHVTPKAAEGRELQWRLRTPRLACECLLRASILNPEAAATPFTPSVRPACGPLSPSHWAFASSLAVRQMWRGVTKTLFWWTLLAGRTLTQMALTTHACSCCSQEACYGATMR